jgi:hypothetical protein
MAAAGALVGVLLWAVGLLFHWPLPLGESVGVNMSLWLFMSGLENMNGTIVDHSTFNKQIDPKKRVALINSMNEQQLKYPAFEACPFLCDTDLGRFPGFYNPEDGRGYIPCPIHVDKPRKSLGGGAGI